MTDFKLKLSDVWTSYGQVGTRGTKGKRGQPGRPSRGIPLVGGAAMSVAGWTWVNQAGSSVVEENGRVIVTHPANQGGEHLLVTALHPKTQSIGVSMMMSPAWYGGNRRVGICLRDSVSGKLMLFEMNTTGGASISMNLEGRYWNNEGSYSQNFNIADSGTLALCTGVMYLRWAFNQGMTTITVQYSFDGLVYIDAHVASTSYFFASQPPDQFGLSCEGLGGGNKIVYFDLQEERYA